ncbi:MAG: hypothetical protein EOO70_09100 [Myxococcaceae bacterium]|nr:MAG: hypothetical protein EOO70_09100 [Myxococcaceae bacterium]
MSGTMQGAMEFGAARDGGTGSALATRRLPARSPAEVGATMERLTRASPGEVVREVDTVLLRMGFDTRLAGQVQQLGYGFREMNEEEMRSGGAAVTHAHDPADLRAKVQGRQGAPIIAMHPQLLIDLRVFAATHGHGRHGVDPNAQEFGAGTPGAVIRAIGALYHERGHAKLESMLDNPPPWLRQEMTRLVQEHGGDEKKARLILHESVGYHVGEVMQNWGRAMQAMQAGQTHGEAEAGYLKDMKETRDTPVTAFTGMGTFDDRLSPEAREQLRRWIPTIRDGYLRTPEGP